jgi:hypothetical protein
MAALRALPGQEPAGRVPPGADDRSTPAVTDRRDRPEIAEQTAVHNVLINSIRGGSPADNAS